MNMKKIFYSLIFFAIFNLTANAQSKEDKAVESAVEAFNTALVDRDRAALEKLAANDLNYGHSGGKVEDKAAFVEAVVEGPFQFKTINAENQTIEVIGKIAIVRHTFVFKANNNGEPVDLKLGNMMVWRKKKDQWKLLARQAYKL